MSGPRTWIPRVTVVLRPADGGGYEAIATEGVPFDVTISAQTSCTYADATLRDLTDVLMSFGFAGEIVLEDRSQPGQVHREVLRKN